MPERSMEQEFALVRALVFEPYTLSRVRPMAGRYVNVSEAGYRSTGRAAAWPPDPNAMNIFVFGGSTAFGYGVADHETIAAHLGELLRDPSGLGGALNQDLRFARSADASNDTTVTPSESEGSGCAGGAKMPLPRAARSSRPLAPARGDNDVMPIAIVAPRRSPARNDSAVYNFASPNYSSVQERIRFEQLLIDGHVPRVAIFIDGFDEFVAPYYAPLTLQTFFHPERTYSLRRRLRRLLPRSLARVLADRDEIECRLPDPEKVLEQYLRNRRLIAAACREHGIRPLFVWQPVPCYRYAMAGEHRGRTAPLLEVIANGFDMMRDRFGDGDDTLWLADMQAGRNETLYVDPDHYTAAFSREIAMRIAQHLQERT